MPIASTDIGKEFTRKYELIVENLAKLETSGRVTDEHAFASALSDYFDYIQRLPDSLSRSQHGYTALYEVDRVMEGFYSDEQLQLYQDNPKEMRNIVIDYSALLQKFFLLPKMTQADGRYGKLPGVDRFYTRWKEDIERAAGGTKPVTEYERACADAEILINRGEYSTEVRFSLLSRLGEIVVTLGVDLDFVQSRLRHYADHIANREPLGDRVINGEVLLNLQALYTISKDFKNAVIPADILSKAIRFWSSRDEFLDFVFKGWKWNWQNDYTSPIAWGERAQLIETSELYRAWANGQTRLGVSRSFLEYEEHRVKKPTELFQPIPIFILGRSFVGKSSFFTAMNYEITARGGDTSRKLTFGQQLQAYYDMSYQSWMENKSVPTAAYVYFDFWRDVDMVGYCTYDYRGGDAEPQQWEPTLQEMFRNARGIVFMIDNEDLESPVKMRARASWSRTILDYWRNSNPQARHVPVALVINKVDLITPDAVPYITRTTLLPDDFQAAFVENYAMSRFVVEQPDVNSPWGRFKDCLLHDPPNNVHPKLQDLVYDLTENFTQFFSRLLDATYHYQIFLMSSLAPQGGDRTAFPWGVLRPFLWMTEILQEEHISESIPIYESELKTLESEIAGMQNGLETLKRLWEEIEEHQREVEEERKKKIRFALTQREERIKHLQKLVMDAEADFGKTAEAFVETPPKNRDEVFAVLQRKIRMKSELLETLSRRVRNYQTKLEQRK
jgi:GTP-binding protein EngB required for normal cell division